MFENPGPLVAAARAEIAFMPRGVFAESSVSTRHTIYLQARALSRALVLLLFSIHEELPFITVFRRVTRLTVH
jgi:hypothetical protein